MASRPKTKLRTRATGICERSGLGISVRVSGSGRLLSGPESGRTTLNSMNRPTHGSSEVPESAAARLRIVTGFLPFNSPPIGS